MVQYLKIPRTAHNSVLYLKLCRDRVNGQKCTDAMKEYTYSFWYAFGALQFALKEVYFSKYR